MKIYHYHPVTKELLATGVADKDPLVEDNWLIPAHATSVKPPEVEEHQVAVFLTDNWAVVPDYRGLEYWLQNGDHHVINELNIEPPEDYLTEMPEPEPPSLEDLMIIAEQRRVMAYADPITGSDKLFMEAIRKSAAGDEKGAFEAEQAGIARVEQIKQEFPLGV